MILKSLKITTGAIEIEPDTDINVNTEYVITCPIAPTGIFKTRTDGEETEETWNMKICGSIEILDTKSKEKVVVKEKATPSQRLRLAIERLADRKGIVEASNIQAYYEKIINNLINQYNKINYD